MQHTFERYRDRVLRFEQILQVEDWQIKVYTISNRPAFESHTILQNAMNAVPDWLPGHNRTDLPVYNLGWLIVHEGREGAWVLFSWWTGGEMIETIMHFAGFDTPNTFQPSPYSRNAMICVWELEVVIYERQAWINHVLKKPEAPDFTAYLADTAGGER